MANNGGEGGADMEDLGSIVKGMPSNLSKMNSGKSSSSSQPMKKKKRLEIEFEDEDGPRRLKELA